MSDDVVAEIFASLTQFVEVSAFSGSCHPASFCFVIGEAELRSRNFVCPEEFFETWLKVGTPGQTCRCFCTCSGGLAK